MGFEPTVGLHPRRFSRPLQSTALPPIRGGARPAPLRAGTVSSADVASYTPGARSVEGLTVRQPPRPLRRRATAVERAKVPLRPSLGSGTSPRMNRPGRRSVLALSAMSAGGTVLPGAVRAQEGTFEAFLDGLRAEARGAGISPATLTRALSGVRPNDRVVELDRRQPESTLTWETYRDRIVSQARIDNGRRAHADNRPLLDTLQERYRVPGRVVVAIWGMETNYGTNTGGFGVMEALATLAWEGRRAAYFRGELLSALRILEAGHVTPARMRGSWAGAMGQPQFMPSSFERLAVDADGDGRKDIWDNRADALGSIANYLARSGWREEERWGREVRLPDGFDTAVATRENVRPLREWAAQGLAFPDGTSVPDSDMGAAVVIPGVATGSRQAFLVYGNFNAIRRYNPSNFYALAVGLLSDRVA